MKNDQEVRMVYSAYYSTIDGLHFGRGNRYCWQTKDGYVVAQLIDDVYCHHKRFTHLKDALYALRSMVALKHQSDKIGDKK